MDTLNVKNDYKYYDGYEPEPELVITLNNEKYHIWDGFFYQIIKEPYAFQVDWKGFTRDFHLLTGIYDIDSEIHKIEPKEYLEDLLHYKDNNFSFPESREVFNLLVSLLTRAINENLDVFIEII